MDQMSKDIIMLKWDLCTEIVMEMAGEGPTHHL